MASDFVVPTDDQDPQKRINDALTLDMSVNIVPSPETVPMAVVRVDIGKGIVRIGTAFRTDLDVRITYIRLPDLLNAVAQIIQVRAMQELTDKADILGPLGDLVGGKKHVPLVLTS